jgi:rSAM/selenodomain-associated transferase 1
MATVRICVFAKPPRPGQVKTRLASALGDQGAAELAGAFLRDTLALVQSLPWAELVVATTGDLGDLVPAGVEIWLQGDGDLGRRLERVMRRALHDREQAVALGADTPGLPGRLLEQGRAALAAGHDAALGPAEDGGFYLLGLRRCPEGLFQALPWSAAETLERTRGRLLARGLSVELIEPWFDVDREQDLARLARLIEAGELRAEETARVLSARAGTSASPPR